MYKSYMKNALYLITSVKLRFASAIRSLDKHGFLPSFSNGIKNDITNSVTHIIVCLLKTK